MTDLFSVMSPKADISFDILVTQQSKNNQTIYGSTKEKTALYDLCNE